MRAAIPLFGARVAPTFLHCNAMRLARIVSGQVLDEETLQISGLTEDERIRLLEERKVSTLVCGGISQDLMNELRRVGIEVINNVAGDSDEALARLAEGRLYRGYGIWRERGIRADSNRADGPGQQREAAEEDPLGLDCMECPDRPCLENKPCSFLSLDAEAAPAAIRFQQTMEVAGDIAAEPERALCRIAELIYYCLGMEHRHVGLAFCADLFEEAETVARLLRRFLRVTAVCCRAGKTPECPGEDAMGPPAPLCNPFSMARVLNQAKTDLNVMIGLCIGCDVVFAQLSRAPTTALFVKDRLLANNPISAVHSRYVLERILK